MDKFHFFPCFARSFITLSALSTLPVVCISFGTLHAVCLTSLSLSLCFKTIMQGVLKEQEDYSCGRKYFLETKKPPATDHEFLMMGLYVNVYKGFVPQNSLPMPDAAVVRGLCPSREGYKYEMAISAVHTGVLPESVMCSAKRLMEFMKGHIVLGDQSNSLRGALKFLLPKSMLRKLGPVRYPNVQKDLRQKRLSTKCIQEQGSTMVRLSRCP